MKEKPLLSLIDEQPYPLVFATISGAHLYGFPSPDSDYDLRGTHLLPAREVVGMDTGPETIETSTLRQGLEVDLVTHDARKFFNLMLKKNGYVLEQLYSPLVLQSSPAHDELLEIGKGCITRYHAHHYLGFAATEWRLFAKEEPHRVKPLLYIYRVLLTGIHLMRTGEIEANLVLLNEEFKLPYISELIARKLAGPEKGVLAGADMAFHEAEYSRLITELEEAQRTSKLPERATAKPALNDLLIRLRLGAPGP